MCGSCVAWPGHPRAGRHFPDGEAHLVAEGRRVRFDDWQRLCDYWRDAADPDGPERRHGRDQDLRRFRIGVGLDGVGHADGYLTPVATAAVNGALERIERELFAADWAAAKADPRRRCHRRPSGPHAPPNAATTPWSRWPPGP